jgi:hypothetical protein
VEPTGSISSLTRVGLQLARALRCAFVASAGTPDAALEGDTSLPAPTGLEGTCEGQEDRDVRQRCLLMVPAVAPEQAIDVTSKEQS